MKIPFAVGDGQARSKSAASQLLVNMYAEPNPEESKYPYTLYGTPGTPLWADLDTDLPIYGMHVTQDQLFVVSGANVYLVNTLGNKTLLGNIGANSSRVFMGDTRTQTGILKSDGSLWVTDGLTVTQVTDPDYQQASSLTTGDGYAILTRANSDQFFISGLYDMTSYDASEFATAEESSDTLVVATTFNSGLWLFGTFTYEVWANTGGTDFPFEPIPGAGKTTRGCGAAQSVTQEDNTLFWLGDDGIIWKAQSFDPIRVSTFAIEELIRKVENKSDAFSFSYTQAGHKFVVFTFPSGNLTICLDLSTQLWHRRETYGLGRWLVNAHASYANLELVGDYRTGKIYYLDLDTFTDSDDNTPISRQIYTQPLWAEEYRVTEDMLFLDIDGGVGITDGQGEDPIVSMQYSDDGGQTFSNEIFGYIGRIGEYTNLVRWPKLGQFRQRIHKFVITDPVNVKINGAYALVRLGKT